MAKTFIGVVSSDKGDKTIVITETTRKTHPLYKKQYTASRKFMAHDANNEARLGDTVIIEECRPVSKHKKFTLKTIVERAGVEHVESEPEIIAKVKEEKAARKATTKASDEIEQQEKTS